MSKKWVVRTEYYSPLQGWLIVKLPAKDVARMKASLEPSVTERRYRWRWLAVLNCITNNAFNAFNPAILHGAVRSTLHRV